MREVAKLLHDELRKCGRPRIGHRQWFRHTCRCGQRMKTREEYQGEGRWKLIEACCACGKPVIKLT